jgi:hypothetical protein
MRPTNQPKNQPTNQPRTDRSTLGSFRTFQARLSLSPSRTQVKRDCVWKPWSPWENSECNKCTGLQTRSREKIDAVGGGEPCVGNAS